MSSFQKKRQGGYYNQNNFKKKRNFVLEPGLKGFICTCNSREKECVREAYNILNDYADRLYESEEKVSDKTEEARKPLEENEDEDDIDTALSKEISNLKQGPNKQWRFNMIESGANNCVFIKTTLPDPTELAYSIMTDIDTTKKQRSRFLLRLIPVETTCKAYMDEIRKNAAVLIDKYFSKEGKTFAIVFNHRNNNSIKRNDVIEELAEMIKVRHVDNKVDLSQPQLTFIIEIIRSMCCMSVVPDYFKLLKYNLLELCGKGEKGSKEGQANKAEGDVCNEDNSAVEEKEKISPKKSDHDNDNTGETESDNTQEKQSGDKPVENTESPSVTNLKQQDSSTFKEENSNSNNDEK
ncbi:hypothetical protein R5R35_008230 [Gryllus longicercus]|uniref:THUMP domain-containing protein n=1 Tax=Gryllus longicercus TaxID=2509291 RepID=A0AAN9W2C0_9ORTH